MISFFFGIEITSCFPLFKISDVNTIAEGTENNVNVGFETLQSNLDKMAEITESNVATINGILSGWISPSRVISAGSNCF